MIQPNANSVNGLPAALPVLAADVPAAAPVVAAAAMVTGTRPGKASVAQVGRAVFWSFIGIRQSAGHESDVARITPAQAIGAGLIGAALFVTSLVVLVRILTAK